MEVDLSTLRIFGAELNVVMPHVTTDDPLFDAGLDMVRITCRLDVVHRDTGERTQVGEVMRFSLESWERLSHEGRLRAVVSLVSRTVVHEAMEHFKLNGVRVFDPHAEVTL